MKTAYDEGWDAGYFGWPRNNPYLRGWARNDALMFGHPLASNWDNGWRDGAIAADAERAAENKQRICDQREGFE